MSQNLPQEEFLTENKKRYTIQKMLGQGAQGIVYKISGRDLALKEILNRGNRIDQNDPLWKDIRNKIMNLRYLPLDKTVCISRPLEVLKDCAGYVMYFMQGLTPIKEYNKTDHPNKNANYPESVNGYIYNDGMRARLKISQRIAATLSQIHSIGIVYEDISDNNIFVSLPSDKRNDVQDEGIQFHNHLNYEVWLIDADNLHFFDDPQNDAIFVTPGFAAPELLQKLVTNSSLLSDCHAFAVLTFEFLTLVHPFKGSYYQNDDDWGDPQSGSNAEQECMRGLVPWIDDLDDQINTSAQGIPRAFSLTPLLRSLYQETFGRGRTQHQCRPHISHWADAFARAADQTVLCPQCGWQYYHQPKKTIHTTPKCGLCGFTYKGFLVESDSYFDCTESNISPRSSDWYFTQEISFDHKENCYSSTLESHLFAPYSAIHRREAVLKCEIREQENTKNILMNFIFNSDSRFSQEYKIFICYGTKNSRKKELGSAEEIIKVAKTTQSEGVNIDHYERIFFIMKPRSEENSDFYHICAVNITKIS